MANMAGLDVYTFRKYQNIGIHTYTASPQSTESDKLGYCRENW